MSNNNNQNLLSKLKDWTGTLIWVIGVIFIAGTAWSRIDTLDANSVKYEKSIDTIKESQIRIEETSNKLLSQLDRTNKVLDAIKNDLDSTKERVIRNEVRIENIEKKLGSK